MQRMSRRSPRWDDRILLRRTRRQAMCGARSASFRRRLSLSSIATLVKMSVLRHGLAAPAQRSTGVRAGRALRLRKLSLAAESPRHGQRGTGTRCSPTPTVGGAPTWPSSISVLGEATGGAQYWAVVDSRISTDLRQDDTRSLSAPCVPRPFWSVVQRPPAAEPVPAGRSLSRPNELLRSRSEVHGAGGDDVSSKHREPWWRICKRQREKTRCLTAPRAAINPNAGDSSMPWPPVFSSRRSSRRNGYPIKSRKSVSRNRLGGCPSGAVMAPTLSVRSVSAR